MSADGRSLFLGYEAVRGFDGNLGRGDRIELDADTLVRHAFVCGASGAGKTVFAKGIVEEAILAGIPVVAVDFKGDIASLAVTGRLATRGALRSVFDEDGDDVYAEFTDGLARNRAASDRAARFANAVDARLFTPDASLGRRLAMAALPSFPDPVADPHDREEQDKLTESLVRGFASAMFGTNRKSTEAPTKVLEALVRWCNAHGEPLEGADGIARILQLVQDPPFPTVGGLAIRDYLDQKRYQMLITGLNSRLVGAERNRYQGPRMSVETLIGGVEGRRVPLAVVYLGHLNDFMEQALVLGQLCADIYRWMRQRGGSRRARLLLYVDELGGGDNRLAFYPSYPNNPPSKAPLNLLVRQGRSAGVCVLLATQNPMSVDVRGLGNVNTWAIGRLTQKNDHERIKDVLAETPQGAQRALQEVARMPAGAFLTRTDAWPAPKMVWERWLYSVHRQLTGRQVNTVHELLMSGVSAPAAAPRVVPPPVPDEPTDARPYGEATTAPVLPAPVPPDPREAETRTLVLASPVRWHVSHADRRWEVGAAGVKVGRSSGADVQVDDPHVSRLHVELVPDGEELVVRALQSKNPTLVDGRSLRGDTRLEVGEHTITLGSVEVALVGRAAGPLRL